MPVFVVPPDKPSLCEYGKQWAAAWRNTCPRQAAGPRAICSRTSPSRRTWRSGRRWRWTAGPILMTPHDYPDWLKPNEAFVVSDVTVDELTGGMIMRRFASTGELIRALKNHSIYFSPDVRVKIHSRILQPLLDITLLVSRPAAGGGPRQSQRVRGDRHVHGPGGPVFHRLDRLPAVGRELPDRPASLAAWAPLMIFVPAAVGMSSAMWER